MDRFALSFCVSILLILSLGLGRVSANESRMRLSDSKENIQLRLQNSQYVSAGANYYREGATSENTSLALQLDKSWRLPRGFLARVDFKNEYSGSENWNYLNVYQLYGHTRFEGVDFTFGRKIELWNAIDAEWKQGIVHSRHMQNRLRPEPAGLFGLFAGQRTANGNWLTGVLPLFIPDIGAHFFVQEGRLTSQNPWFDPPASRFRFRGEAGEIRYSVKPPSASEIALNPGWIGSLEHDFGAESGVRVTLAHKPIPQLLLGFPSLNRVIVGANEDYLQVDITPKVMYHSVASVESWTRAGEWTLTSGVTLDAPNGNAFDSTYTKQTYAPAWIYALTASRPLEEEGRFAARLKFGVLKVDGGATRDRGVFAREKSLFERRFQYDEAYLLALQYQLRGITKRPLEASARLVYDRIQNGGSLGLQLGYLPAPRWRIDAEIEMLGLLGNDNGEANGFFSTYRANDRLALGTSYVF